jgi:hypothetical protein
MSARVEVTLKCVVDTDVSDPSQDDVGDAFHQFLGEMDSTTITDMLTYTVLEESKPKRYKDTPEQAIADCRLTSFQYYAGKFRKFFTSPYQQYEEYVGSPFKVLGIDKQGTKDAGETLYRIQLKNGMKITAWGLEVCKPNRKKCS